jgi:hypothetical protein
MKTVLLLAFLALGPALADQTPAVPPVYEPVATVPVARAGRLHATDQIAAQAPLSADERTRLCGGGS